VLTLVDGVKIVVPNSLNLITPYVLREQPDFFEDELKSVSKLIGPGQKVSILVPIMVSIHCRSPEMERRLDWVRQRFDNRRPQERR